jgi:hypothetical protein
MINVVTIMLNICSFFALIFVTYAVLGTNLYAPVMLQEHYNDVNNFRSFGNGVMLLIGCLTGQKWQLIMSELALTEEYNGVQCVYDQTYQDWQRDGVIGCGS